MITLRANPTYHDVLHIAENLRPRDKAELFATHYGEDPHTLANEAVAAGSFKWATYLNGTPVAVVGAFPRWPHVWTAWAYGTPDWPKTAITLTRHVRRFMLPALYNSGAIRVDAMALDANTDACRWLEGLGAKREFVLDNYGKAGEKFVSYVWTRETTKQLLKL